MGLVAQSSECCATLSENLGDDGPMMVHVKHLHLEDLPVRIFSRGLQNSAQTSTHLFSYSDKPNSLTSSPEGSDVNANNRNSREAPSRATHVPCFFFRNVSYIQLATSCT